ncbi:solute carrier family 23 protein [Pseudorhodoferax sp.]|uniref:solute carrier family 23 protein n=1 Tax=Pseudorhodoferax sp. TaxID=1993553 RepID=UPI002DD6A49D|nr:solute carrier family 23 protein [Pseudorhodoferax sp.]
MAGYFPRWTLVRPTASDTVVGPYQRLPWPHMFWMGLQHVVAMFGATVIAPLLMGFNPNVAILMSGIGTLIFFVCVGGRVPSYLGSSFAFIGGVIAVTGYAGQGINANLGPALGGIIACGALYAAIGLVVAVSGTAWIEKLMPPVVTGAIVAVIGLNLATVAIKGIGGSTFETSFALATVVVIGLVAVSTGGMVQRLMLLVGVLVSYAAYLLVTSYGGIGKPIDFQAVANAPWFGVPAFASPSFTAAGISLIAPVALILVAENLGHVKAVAAISGQNMDRYIGRAFFGDGVATMLSGAAGGTGVTTYAENIGVMTVTRIFSTLAFVVAACIAIVLGFSPKFGALIMTIPAAVLGGVSIVVFGLIAIAGVRIWVGQRVDLTNNKNLIVASAILIAGTGDLTLHLGDFALHGIGTATFGGIALHAVLTACERRSTARAADAGRDPHAA